MASVCPIILATASTFLPLIILFLLVAAYMFAALKYPALRFVFRLKRFGARAFGVDAEANRNLGEKLGLILCPLFGVGALFAAGSVALEWNQSHISAIQSKKEKAARYEAWCADVTKLLRTGEISDVYFDTTPRLNVSEQGRDQVEDFIRRMGNRSAAEIYPTPLKPAERERGALTVLFKPEEETTVRRQISMFTERDELEVRIQNDGNLAKVPEELRAAWDDLGNLERIDSVAIRNEESRKRKEIERRLSSYELRTFIGTPAWQIHDLADSPQQSELERKAKEYVGMEFDWECRLSKVEEKDGKLNVEALQHSPKSGGAWPIRFTVEKSQLPDAIEEPRLVFLRIHGFIESMEKGIGVKVDKLERFKPLAD